MRNNTLFTLLVRAGGWLAGVGSLLFSPGPAWAQLACQATPPTCPTELVANGDFEQAFYPSCTGSPTVTYSNPACSWGETNILYYGKGYQYFTRCAPIEDDVFLLNSGCYNDASSPFYGQQPTPSYTMHGIPVNFANYFSTLSVPSGSPLSYATQPRSGSAFAGFGFNRQQTGIETGYIYMEQKLAAGRHLTAPGNQPRAYYVEFYVQLAPDSQLFFDYVGLAVQPVRIPSNSYAMEFRPATPQLLVKNTTPLFAARPGGWQRVSGVLTIPAGGYYDQIAIGVFPSTISPGSPGPAPGPAPASLPICDDLMGQIAYYYLDDVSIRAVSAGPDQAVCLGGTVTLGAGCALPASAGATYSWSASSPQAGLNATTGPNPTATPQAAGTYVYTAVITIPGSAPITTSVTVNVGPVAGPAQTIALCASATLGVQCPQANATYQWSGPGGAVAGGASLTVQPTTTTTYTLTVTLPGTAAGTTTTYTTTTTITVLPSLAFAQAAGGNYNPRISTPQGPPVGQPTYELGERGRVTKITRNNFNDPAAPVFSGSYHVVGPLLFEDGDFQVLPGTVFYMDGGMGTNYNPIDYPVPAGTQCMASPLKTYNKAAAVDPRHFLQLFVGTGATLTLDGARLTSTCDKMWGGVELAQNGTLLTQGNSTIEHARVGVLTGTLCRTTTAHYSLTNTSFVNNTYGVVIMGEPYRPGAASNQVRSCTFRSDRAQRRAPDDGLSRGRTAADGDYTRVGLTMVGENYSVLAQNNTFTGLAVGAELAMYGLTFEQNQLERCYDTGIRTFAGVNYGPSNTYAAEYMTVQNNVVQVPTDVAVPGGQINAGNPVLGIDVLNPYQYIEAITFTTNQVLGAVPLNSRARPGYGMQAINGEDYFIIYNNDYKDLDIGVRVADMVPNPWGYSGGLYSNLFQRVGSGVSFNYFPQVSCNDFRSYSTGINLESSTDLTQLGQPNYPCENYFDSSGSFYVRNNRTGTGPSALLNYYYDAGRNEIPMGNYPSNISYIPTSPYRGNTTGCGSRGLQRGTPTTSLTQVAAWRQQVVNQTGTQAEQRQAEAELVRYYTAADSLLVLKVFTAQLPKRNAKAFRRLSLSAMQQLRRRGDEAQAQLVRGQLLGVQGGEMEVAAQVLYFDVVGHLRASGGQLQPADSAVLAQVATAPVVAAPAACALLHALRPNWACTRQVADASTQVGTVTEVLQAYPNPASSQVRVVSSAGTAGALFEVLDLSGRVVRTLRLDAAGQGSLSVAGLAGGVYVGRVPGRRALGTCKIVVLP